MELFSKPTEKSKITNGHSGDYTIIDIETTGLNAETADITEVAAIRVRNFEIRDTFHSFSSLPYPVPTQIVNLTGITDDMLKGAPNKHEALCGLVDFIGDDVILGHNVISFDIPFINKELAEVSSDICLNNTCVDTYFMAKKQYPQLQKHRLCDMAESFGIACTGAHRAMFDCETTHECYLAMLKDAPYVAVKHYPQRVDAKKIMSCPDGWDREHALFAKNCVITGDFEHFSRRELMQKLSDIGAAPANNVTKSTDVLIIGCFDNIQNVVDSKSRKQLKAEEYIAGGQNILILYEPDICVMLDV